MANSPAEQALKKRLDHWITHPLDFVIETRLIPGVTDQQANFYREWGKLIAAKRKVQAGEEVPPELLPYVGKVGISIMSGKGTGKDCTGANIAHHWMATQAVGRKTKILVTAPSAHQLDDVFWSELNKWFNRTDDQGKYQYLFRDEFDLLASKYYNKQAKENWFCVGRTTASGKASAQAGKLAGFHEDSALFICDEASETPDESILSMITTLTNPMNLALLIFNPTKRSGYAYRTHYDPKIAKDWIQLQWDSRESPLVAPEMIERFARHGRRSNVFRVNVMGLPPLADDDALIPWDWCHLASQNPKPPIEGAPRILGVDVAGNGKHNTVLVCRQGSSVGEFHVLDKTRQDDLEKAILQIAMQESADYIVLDATGLGSWLAERLQRSFPNVYGAIMNATAFDDERFYNVRAEIYWKLREAFEKGNICIPPDDDLIGELTTTKYTHRKAQILLEPKTDIRDRLGGRSPDKADALALTYYIDEVAAMDADFNSRRSRYFDDDDDEFDNDYSWLAV